jgi:hypothetical protein
VSLQYSCLTLGVGTLLLALLENRESRAGNLLSVYGRVPFFYYVFHFLLIHLVCMVIFMIRQPGDVEVDSISPYIFCLADIDVPIPVGYGIWLCIVLLMYYPCYYYGRYKQANKQKWWLSYI